MKLNYEFSSIEVIQNRKNKKIVTAIIILIIIFFIYLGIKQLINENISKGQDNKENIIDLKEEQIKEENKVITEEIKNKIKGIYTSKEKRVFLTFDDGPSNITGHILDILKEKNIKATFFVLGSNVDKKPEIVKRTYEEGHFIANHSYTHIYEDIYRSKESVLDEYIKCNESISRAIGKKYDSHLFRYPGGYLGESTYTNIKKESGEFLEKNDIMHVDWNALTGDSEKINVKSEDIMKNLKNTTSGKNSVVLLMHDAGGKEITSNTLPSVIDYLESSGYEFKSFYDILKKGNLSE